MLSRNRIAGADGGAVDVRNRQRIAVGIEVVRQHSHNDRCIFRCCDGIVAGCWWQVENGPGERCGHRAAIAVVARDGDGIDAVVARSTDRRARIERPGDAAGCCVERQPHRQPRYRVGQRIAVDVREGICEIEADRLTVGICQVRQWRDGCRSVVDGIDRHGNGCGRDAAVTIANLIDDGVGAIEIRGRRIVDCAIGLDRDRAVTGSCSGNGEWIAIGIGIVDEDIDVDERIFVRSRRVIDSGRPGVGNDSR